MQRLGRGEKLTADEADYLERAKAARRAGQQPQPGRANQPAGGKEKMGFKPLTEMSADEPLPGRRRRALRCEPEHAAGRTAQSGRSRARARAAARSRGQPAKDGRIAFISISMSNATQEFRSSKKSLTLTRRSHRWSRSSDCAKEAKRWPNGLIPRRALGLKQSAVSLRRDISDQQVQVAWIKLANKGPRGALAEHGRKLEKDTLAVIQNAKSKYPNLRVVYLSSRIYGGYSTGALNPEPYAYESAFAARWAH